MKSDIVKTAKVSTILFASVAIFVAGCAVIGFIIPLAVLIVALVYGTVSEERWERERAEKLANR